MKKILRLLKRRKNGGFTLVEVIISSVLLGILVLAVVGLVTPVMQTVMLNEKNANALMVAEAAEAYIDRNIKNSVFCAVFTNAVEQDVKNAGTSGKIKDHVALQEMLDFLADGTNKDIYDLKIIGLSWQEDNRTHQYKYMVTSPTVKLNDAAAISSVNTTGGQVFEECFYDNFFPAFTFEVLPYTEYEDDGTTVKSTKNVAIRTVIDVYSNSSMTALAAQGKGYAEFINIRTPSINRGDIYKLYSTNGEKDGDGNVVGGVEETETTRYTRLRTDDEFESEFGDTAHPNTYIFYVTRKLKYYEPPATP